MSDRADRLVQALPAAGVDVMLVSRPLNVRYLTGYTGSNGIAIIGPQTRTFITDFRYVEQAKAEVDPSYERMRASQELISAVAGALPSGSLRLGFEDEHVTVARHGRLREALSDRIELVGVGAAIERLRAVKEPSEVAAMRAAAELADAAFERVVGEGLEGRTEREAAIALNRAMQEMGAQRASFDTIVAAGSQAALPHGQPRDVEIRRGDVVVIDWGAFADGYCSDCTRTVAVGTMGEDERAVYELVLSAQLAGLEAVRAGAVGREVDTIARGVIADGGQAERFGHGLGHGVGLDIHEDPRLSQSSEAVLEPGNAVTVEPGVYLPGRFGVRIEDLVVVRSDGCEILTSVPKEPRITD